MYICYHIVAVTCIVDVLYRNKSINHSWLANLLSSLIARWGSDLRLYDGSDLKTYLLMRWQGPGALAVVRPTGVCLLDFFFSFMYC